MSKNTNFLAVSYYASILILIKDIAGERSSKDTRP